MKNTKLAAVVRYEILSNLIHPCAVFFNKSILDSINFHVVTTPNFIGDRFFSVTLDQELIYYPLIRTNEWNPHPIFAGIYGNCFYHHGCGSRKVIGDVQYHDIPLQKSSIILEKITNNFNKNPSRFIKKLSEQNIPLL